MVLSDRRIVPWYWGGERERERERANQTGRHQY
jgi:hypothetical protein